MFLMSFQKIQYIENYEIDCLVQGTLHSYLKDAFSSV